MATGASGRQLARRDGRWPASSSVHSASSACQSDGVAKVVDKFQERKEKSAGRRKTN